ncbi:metallophosphoesterase [Devosia sp. RR2S18]|uniref:metallophosphoesterase n=1 Tax=Devosia rhizosphaerae TaxID=3049774 RepID=UPI0025407352|nr:metallophosphoesterase [Devosia sp. RR2S18]WIJ26361.1 metallophosphoesterase [Devosia sp. RR2S18]
MKIWLFSDLHMTRDKSTFSHFFRGIPDADVCVCAGDLIEQDPGFGVEWLDFHIGQYMPCLYVPGNHEFYSRSHSIQSNRALAGQAAARTSNKVHVLDDMGITIDGIRFLGTTLWSDFRVLCGDDDVGMACAMAAAQNSVSDFRFIHKPNGKTWTPKDAMLQHAQSVQWLDEELERSELPTVVVSHHAPHPDSIATEWQYDLCTAAFVSNLSELIERHQPKLWLHGHTHDSFDYSVGNTKVICNPHGYRTENYAHWKRDMVIEVSEYSPKPRF